MTTYRVTLTDGEQYLLHYDPVHAAAPITAQFAHDEPENWHGTPYQTADARDERHAATLTAEYFAVEPGDCTEVKSVEEAGVLHLAVKP